MSNCMESWSNVPVIITGSQFSCTMQNSLIGNLHSFVWWLGARLFQNNITIRMLERCVPTPIVSLQFPFFSPATERIQHDAFKTPIKWGYRNKLTHIAHVGIILSLIAYTFRENWDFVSIFIVLWILWYVYIVGYILACRSYSFVCTLHHLIIIIVQTYQKTLNLWNACQIYSVDCVSKIKHILSVIHHTIWWDVCFQFTHSPCVDSDNVCTLSYCHHQIGSMDH